MHYPISLILVVLIALPGGPALGATDLRAALKLLESRDPRLREKGVAMLEEIPGRSSLLLILRSARDEDVEVRGRARRVLLARRSPEDLRTIAASGMKSASARVRRAALDALAAARVSDLEAVLARAVADADPGVREAAVEHIVNTMGGRGPQLLAAAVLRGREGRPRAAALAALVKMDGERARHLAGGLLADREFEVRVAALEALARGPKDEARSALLSGLDDDSWSVRLTAMREMALFRETVAIPALIRSLRREAGRLKEEAGDALSTLTGIGLPASADRWEKWWAGAKETFELPDAPAVAKERESGSVATFHSIPLHSECVAFVLDRSRSMRDRLKRGEGKTKAELVEAELSRTLEKLKAPARFFLVAFGTEPEVFAKRSARAGPCTRRAAIKWFRKRRLEGRTNIFDSLVLALDRPEVDTVFLLTDGAPSAGEERTRSGILSEVSRRNRFKKAVIHTVEIGGDATGKRWRGFLADLARQSGGRHVRR